MCVLLFMLPLMAGELDKLSFLKGCWAGAGSFEMWMKPEAGSMLGIGRTIRNGKVVNTEFFSIAEAAEGVVLNVQLKLGGTVTPFRAKEITTSLVIFENPDHDFPQRIIYRAQPDGSLLGRIEGKNQGQERAFDYPMTRAKCD
jgi:Domain of unknown function (DUF6265)